MKDEELRNKAKDLLEQVEDVLVDVGVSGWPWRPYALQDDEEFLERQRHRLLVELQEEEKADARVRIAMQLVGMDGYVLEDGILELDTNEYRLFGHLKEINKVVDLEDFSEPFRKTVKGWDSDAPDWRSLERYLLRKLEIDPARLEQLNLIHIRRLLIAGPPRKANSKKRRTSESLEWMTPQQERAWALSMKGMSLSQIGVAMGISKSGAAGHVAAAKKKVALLGEASTNSRFSWSSSRT